MTNEEVERAIQFLIDHHAKVSAQSERNSEQIAQLNQTVSIMASQAETDRAEMREAIRALIANSDANLTEVREAIGALILANEVTRDLAEKTARLAIETSQRVDKLESRS